MQRALIYGGFVLLGLILGIVIQVAGTGSASNRLDSDVVYEATGNDMAGSRVASGPSYDQDGVVATLSPQAPMADPLASDESDSSSGGSEAESPETRKIIRDANLSLRVEEYEAAKAEIDAIVAEVRGFYGDVYVTHVDDRPSSANLVLRIPADQLDATISRLRRLGNVTSEQVSSRDITGQFFDTQARVESKQTLERRLLSLLDDSSDAVQKLADIVAVEERLANVRAEIERLQGQLNRWQHQVRYSTLTLSLNMIRPRAEYPDEPIVEPSLGERSGNALNSSARSLVDVGESFVIAGATILPWLPLLLIGGFGFYWFVLRKRRDDVSAHRRRSQAAHADVTKSTPTGGQ